MIDLSGEELRKIALEAEVLRQAAKIRACQREAERVSAWLERNIDKLQISLARQRARYK